jgi:hypothetical protein
MLPLKMVAGTFERRAMYVLRFVNEVRQSLVNLSMHSSTDQSSTPKAIAMIDPVLGEELVSANDIVVESCGALDLPGSHNEVEEPLDWHRVTELLLKQAKHFEFDNTSNSTSTFMSGKGMSNGMPIYAPVQR